MGSLLFQMEAIFSRIISDKNAFFKHQQMNEEELTEDEKMEILKTLSKEKLPVFLSRFLFFKVYLYYSFLLILGIKNTWNQ